MPHKWKEVNLFEDKRDDGWEYGYVQFPDDGIRNSGRRVEIRRKLNSAIYDEVFMLVDDEWISLHKMSIEDASEDMLFLYCAVCSAVSGALNRADNWRTHNSYQKKAHSGKAQVVLIEQSETAATE